MPNELGLRRWERQTDVDAVTNQGNVPLEQLEKTARHSYPKMKKRKANNSRTGRGGGGGKKGGGGGGKKKKRRSTRTCLAKKEGMRAWACGSGRIELRISGEK